MKLEDLKPGRYVLTADVRNPHPDRRSRPPRGDWRKFEWLPAGWHFIVPKHSAEYLPEIRREGGFSHENIYIQPVPDDGHTGAELLAAMLPALEPCAEDTYSILDLEGRGSWYSPLLDRLVQMGKITIADVREASDLEYNAE